jgi:hypothetical protein
MLNILNTFFDKSKKLWHPKILLQSLKKNLKIACLEFFRLNEMIPLCVLKIRRHAMGKERARMHGHALCSIFMSSIIVLYGRQIPNKFRNSSKSKKSYPCQNGVLVAQRRPSLSS